MSLRIVIADDHPVVLAGLSAYFQAEPGFEIVAEALDGDAALESVRRLRPDILVLDLRMPGKGGIEVLGAIGREGLATRVVILTAVQSEEVVEAVRLGACGVVMKDLAASQLLECVREVQAGRKWLDRATSARTIDRLLERDCATRSVSAVLTRRELEIARMVAEGLPSKVIARRLSITEGTTKLHIHHVYAKLDLSGRFALARYMRVHALV